MNILHIMGTFRDNNTLTRITSVTLKGGEKEREESQNRLREEEGKRKRIEEKEKLYSGRLRERGTNRGKSSKKRARGERKK